MTIDLSSYRNIGTALAVRIQVDKYSVNGVSYSQQILTFTDSLYPLVIDDYTFQPLGGLVSIGSTSNELKSTSSPLTIVINGIKSGRYQELMNSKFKGSPVEVWRVVFNPETNQLLSIAGNPAGRFYGVINNYSIDENWEQENRTSSLTISFECSSLQATYENKITGRKTNSVSHRSFYPTDPSMDRVTALAGANFNFGAKQ